MTARCRHCDTPLESTLCDLGMSPLANSYLRDEDLDRAEKFYPLHAFVCSECLLVQLAEFESPEYIFSDYAYFSSFSQSWLEHAHTYVDSVVDRFALGPQHQVVEIASNDGYLLQYFVALGIPVLGIEPAANVAVAAREKGIETLVEFFGTDIALEMVASGRQADLIIGNNVLAHVPALNDFVEGLSILLAPQGRITMEFPHLLQLMKHNQFDTIYHEHFSYFSFLTVSKVFARHGLRLFDVDQVPTHGGSLRIYGCHTDDTTHPQSGRVALLEADERAAGLDHLAGYSAFPEQVRRTKRALLRFLIDARDANKSVVAYGAPAKGNTLLNYCGVKTDLVDYTVDRSPHKQNHFLPGTHLPIYAPERIAETKPDYVLILPWNLKDEIMSEMTHVREWGGKFVVPIPEVTVVD
ncbi:MAG: methyltransferase domain-containing protein [Ilumatobacteraceae bacterium]